MKLIGWGMLVILVDLRYENVDLVVDLGGWLMLYFGLRRIWRLDNAFRVATGGPGCGEPGAVVARSTGGLCRAEPARRSDAAPASGR